MKNQFFGGSIGRLEGVGPEPCPDPNGRGQRLRFAPGGRPGFWSDFSGRTPGNSRGSLPNFLAFVGIGKNFLEMVFVKFARPATHFSPGEGGDLIGHLPGRD